MARYSLILKDQTFVDLVKQAQEKNLTFGKYINQELNSLSQNGKDKIAQTPKCLFCGNEKIVAVALGFSGEKLNLCVGHSAFKNKFNSYKDVI